jgi:hypothetical protein
MRVWIITGVAILGLALAFSAHCVGTQFPGETTSGQPGAYGITLPPGYRNWELISVAAVGSPLNDLRAKLGNDIAMSDLRRGTIPYRDGAIIARLAWKQRTNPQTSNALRRGAQEVGLSADAIGKLLSESFVAGPRTNVQLMLKDSKKYASTGG